MVKFTLHDSSLCTKMGTMRKSTLYLFLLLASSFISHGYGQTKPEVSKPELELRDNKLIIHYDIRNAAPEAKFRISVEITDENGNLISAKSLIGDIGNDITGGNKKEITWDFKQDNFNTQTEIFVQVNAEIQTPPPVVVEEPKKEEVIQEETIAPESIQEDQGKTYALVLWSTAFPGMGFVRMDQSKWHLVKGAAGYGCIASSIIFNRLAVSNYNKYLDSYEIEKSDDYFKKSLKQDNISEALAYTAIGIWAVEIVWIIIESKHQKSTPHMVERRLSIEPGYDPETNSSQIGISYRF